MQDGIALFRIFFVVFSVRLHVSSSVLSFTFEQIFIEFRKNFGNPLPRLDGFAFFVFDFWDKDPLLIDLIRGMFCRSLDFFLDLLDSFLSFRPFCFPDIFFDLFADFTDSFFFVLRRRFLFL